MDKDTKSYLNSLMTAAPKELKNVVLTQGNIIFEVLDRRNMVDKYTAAIIKRTIDYSKETRSSIYNKFKFHL